MLRNGHYKHFVDGLKIYQIPSQGMTYFYACLC